VAAAVDYVARQAPASPTALVGFSLGGTIALNMAAELGASTCGNLVALLAICSPIELHSVKRRFDAPTGRPYDRHFVRALWPATMRQLQGHDDLPHVDWSRPPQRLREFDALITAPLARFASVDDYYSTTSPGPRLAEIRLPTTIVAAADDPVVPIEPLQRARHGEAVEIVITRHGGHLGYIGRRNGDADRRWLDWRVVEWVEAACRRRAAHLAAATTPLSKL
jgi:predicted alpha/beta-fold hydrolase